MPESFRICQNKPGIAPELEVNKWISERGKGLKITDIWKDCINIKILIILKGSNIVYFML